MTREELADWLGDTSASTVNKWERDMHEIPNWVADKLLAAVEITLPLNELHELLDLARHRGVSFTEVLSSALRNYIASERGAEKKVITITPPANAKVAENIPPYNGEKLA